MAPAALGFPLAIALPALVVVDGCQGVERSGWDAKLIGDPNSGAPQRVEPLLTFG